MSRGRHTAQRTEQLVAAAADGMLRYAADGMLVHRQLFDPAGNDIPATRSDAELVADLITAGRLRREDSGQLAVVEKAIAS